MSAWRKNSLPVASFFAIVVAILAAVGFSGSSEMPAVNFNTESGILAEESFQDGVVDAAATSPAANTPAYDLTDYSYPDNSLIFDCCETDPPVIIAELPFPPLPPGYIDPDDDGFLPGSPLSPNGYWTISGRVTDPWGRGISGVGIIAIPSNNNNIGSLPWPFETGIDGYYTVEFGPVWPPDVMAASTFTIYFAGPRSTSYGWVNEWYNNTRDADLATPVPLGSQGVDAVLMPTGIIRGRITNFSDNCFTDAMASCVQIFAYRADRTEVVGSTRTGYMQDGIVTGFTGNAFSLYSLPPGDYKLLAQPNSTIYDNQVVMTKSYEKTWYGPGNSWETATVISVSPGSVADVNITLETPDTSGNNYHPVYGPDPVVEAESTAITTSGDAATPASVEDVSPATPR